jgi:predicted ATPase with chaperone activity
MRPSDARDSYQQGEPEVTSIDPETLSTIPHAPKTIDETGLPEAFLRELVLKVIWIHDRITMRELSTRLGLRSSVIEEALEGLRREEMCDVTAAGPHTTDRSTRYRLTERGKRGALDALQRCRYAGVAPVPIRDYAELVKLQKQRYTRPDLDGVRQALSHLTLDDEVIRLLGQAFFSRLPLMVYGASGNGKTDIIRSLARVVRGNVVIPHTVFVQGQIIRIFDGQAHEPVTVPPSEAKFTEAARYDRRWLIVNSPAVTTGGDMGSEALEMTYDATMGVYNAPLSVAAQGGVLVIDDLGRQRISHEAILNRWVVMMDHGYDSFALNTGELIRLPLDVTLVFSTNLTVAGLADEAFLRRIVYKIPAPNPDRAMLADIARRVCDDANISWSEEGIQYLVGRLFAPGMPEPRGCFPRDIVAIITDEGEFLGHPAALSQDAVDVALRVYLGRETIEARAA